MFKNVFPFLHCGHFCLSLTVWNSVLQKLLIRYGYVTLWAAHHKVLCCVFEDWVVLRTCQPKAGRAWPYPFRVYHGDWGITLRWGKVGSSLFTVVYSVLRRAVLFGLTFAFGHINRCLWYNLSEQVIFGKKAFGLFKSFSIYWYILNCNELILNCNELRVFRTG